MERRETLRGMAIAAGAALVGAARVAEAANGNSSVTLGTVAFGRRRFNVSDPDGVAAVIVFRGRPGGIVLQSQNCGGAGSCVTSIPESDYLSLRHWIVVLDASADPSADLWRVDPGGSPVRED